MQISTHAQYPLIPLDLYYPQNEKPSDPGSDQRILLVLPRHSQPRVHACNVKKKSYACKNARTMCLSEKMFVEKSTIKGCSWLPATRILQYPWWKCPGGLRMHCTDRRLTATATCVLILCFYSLCFKQDSSRMEGLKSTRCEHSYRLSCVHAHTMCVYMCMCTCTHVYTRAYIQNGTHTSVV